MTEKNSIYYKAINSTDPMTVVINGNLAIEAELDNIIQNLTVSDLAIRRAKFNFHHKLNLVIALGLDERFYKPLFKFSKIRNDYAHKYQYTLNRDTIFDLYKTFSDLDRKILLDSYKHTAKNNNITIDPTKLEPLDFLRICVITLRGALVVCAQQTKDYSLSNSDID